MEAHDFGEIFFSFLFGAFLFVALYFQKFSAQYDSTTYYRAIYLLYGTISGILKVERTLTPKIDVVHQAAVGYMGEINATAKNDIVKDFRNRNDEMLSKTVKVR